MSHANNLNKKKNSKLENKKYFLRLTARLSWYFLLVFSDKLRNR